MEMEGGGQCVMISGVDQMLKLCADNLGFQHRVGKAKTICHICANSFVTY